MTILKASRDFTNVEKYLLTQNPGIVSVKDVIVLVTIGSLFAFDIFLSSVFVVFGLYNKRGTWDAFYRLFSIGIIVR
jgi:hypothetical protein